MRVRWREVADLAGVSEATVSRVMNGRPGVSERTRQIVEHAAEQLGAGQLMLVRSRKLEAGLVGLVVPELDNPIFPALAQLLEARLAAAGYTCVLGCVTGGVDELEYLGTLVERGVAGIIMVSGRHADTEGDQTPYHELIAQGIPMVFVNGYDRRHPGAVRVLRRPPCRRARRPSPRQPRPSPHRLRQRADEVRRRPPQAAGVPRRLGRQSAPTSTTTWSSTRCSRWRAGGHRRRRSSSTVRRPWSRRAT